MHILVTVPSASAEAATWLAPLLTYALHALLWTAAATWWARRKTLSPSTRHLFWKLALFGPIATTVLATSLGALPHTPIALELASHPITTQLAPAKQAWSFVAVALLAASALGLARFSYAMLLFRRTIRGRHNVRDPRLLQRLDQMRRRMGLGAIRLTESPRIVSPLVVGPGELCIPTAQLCTLSDAEVDTVLAHELAHLERRDWFWFPAAGFLWSVLWMQPLQHVIASRFHHTAELACDDRAIELTGDRLGLARALTHVAESALATRATRRAWVATMAGSRRALVERVRRLTTNSDLIAARPRGMLIALWILAGATSIGLCVDVAHATMTTAPAVAEASHEMIELDHRGRQLEVDLAAAEAEPSALDPRNRAAMRVIELEQELRHVRAAQAWTEARLFQEVGR